MKKFFTFRESIYYDHYKKSRIGLVCRVTGKTKWFQLSENTLLFHIAKWEEENKVVIYAVCYEPIHFSLYHLDNSKKNVYKYFNETTIVTNTPCEFSVIRLKDIGKPTQWIYYLKISPNLNYPIQIIPLYTRKFTAGFHGIFIRR